jgi:hypothetical protein
LRQLDVLPSARDSAEGRGAVATMSSRDAEAFNAPRSAIVIVSSRACVLWSIQEWDL